MRWILSLLICCHDRKDYWIIQTRLPRRATHRRSSTQWSESGKGEQMVFVVIRCDVDWCWKFHNSLAPLGRSMRRVKFHDVVERFVLRYRLTSSTDSCAVCCGTSRKNFLPHLIRFLIKTSESELRYDQWRRKCQVGPRANARTDRVAWAVPIEYLTLKCC